MYGHFLWTECVFGDQIKADVGGRKGMHVDSFYKAVHPKRVKHLQQLELILGPQLNYKRYRSLLEELDTLEGEPCIPIIGIFIKDLTFMNDGNPKLLENGMIHFAKLSLLYHAVKKFVRYQAYRYHLPTTSYSSNLLPYLNSMRYLKEQALHKYSLLCEARGGEESGRLLNKWINDGK